MVTSLCVSGRQVYNTPQDQVGRILDQVRQRQIAATAPAAIPKKILSKYNVYLPNPPPPKLRARGHPKRRWSDKWTGEMEPQEDSSQGETPRTIPETVRDWFPNAEYQEKPSDDEQKQEQWDSIWEMEEGEEWEEWGVKD